MHLFMKEKRGANTRIIPPKKRRSKRPEKHEDGEKIRVGEPEKEGNGRLGRKGSKIKVREAYQMAKETHGIGKRYWIPKEHGDKNRGAKCGIEGERPPPGHPDPLTKEIKKRLSYRKKKEKRGKSISIHQRTVNT